jgi:serine/threonine-protein kinase
VTFTQAEVRELLVQMGSALAEAHRKNIIHRDIKHSNILVVRKDASLRFVLTDFGIGQVAEGIQVRKHTGGTYFFMAPEQMRGRPCPQSDLWALGVVAYRMLAGRMPFPGPTLGELSRQILYAPPAPLTEGGSEPIDPQLEAVVLGLLDKSLQERTASAEVMLRELGHRGLPSGVMKKASTRKLPSGTGQSRDKKLRLRIKVYLVLVAVCVAFYLLPSAPLAGILLLSGMALFYKVQKEENWTQKRSFFAGLGAFVLLGGFIYFRFWNPNQDYSWMNLVNVSKPFLGRLAPLDTVLGGVVFIILIIASAILGIIYTFLPVIAGAFYATLRRLQREQVLRSAVLADGTGSDRYLEVLRNTLDTRFEDVGFHLKYAEALFARNQVKEATVEARLLLRQDPYNFNGNLLLANGYLTLGLVDECLEVCNRYLKVSGYCFEFSELREQCWRRQGQS